MGVIGNGDMGARHAANIHRYVKGARTAGLYDIDAKKAERIAEECGSAVVFESAAELITDDEIDAIVIASPDHTHNEYALQCLEARKPVLCEKPLATSAVEARPIIDAEAELGRQLVSVGFMRRFDPAHVSLLEAVRSDRIGRARLYKGVHRNRFVPPASPDEHFIHQAAVHDIDASRWLLESEIKRVFVRGVRVDPTLEDPARDLLLINLTFEDSSLAAIEVFLSAKYGYEVTAEVVGESGTLTTLPPDQMVVRTDGSRRVIIDGDWLGRFSDAYILELRHWVNYIRGAYGHEPLATAWDGYLSLLVADACVRSLESGEPVSVTYPSRPEIY